jgi:glycosyltransferase involved in cell wall biosynthesis
MRSIFFDASRLFIRGSRFSPTGIDRVVLAYARWLLGRSDVDLRPAVTAGGRIWEAPRSLLSDIVENAELFCAAARGEGVVSGSWSRLATALEHPTCAAMRPSRAKFVMGQLPARIAWHAGILARSVWRLRPAGSVANSIYVNVSHTGLGNRHVLPKLAAMGARNVVMVHDLIPIEHPEYCAPGAPERHVRRMDGIIGSTALVITNSQTTADSLAAYAKELGRPCPATKVAYLGVEPDFVSPPAPFRASRPYFIHVGTLEARKNLTFLLAVWRRLSERLGPDAPSLVLVGRRGWENESVLDHLERSEAAVRLVHEVSDLQDPQLAALMAGARALLAPSFTEGFDLPVIEALSLGTPVIASDIPVHRELAGSARLIDPLDGPGWIRAIETATDARGSDFCPPQWKDHFSALDDTLLGEG